MKQFLAIILMAFFCGGICIAQSQSSTIHERIMGNSSWVASDAQDLVFGNPAMKRYLYDNTLTTLLLNGDYQKEDLPSVVQEGDGLRMGAVDVKSFIRKKQQSLWGQASYTNGKKLGRCWNETSDYHLIYPYAMGDTLGGDLKSEQYYFMGGYAYDNSEYIVGAEGSYRASIEYRHADPRPKNLTGDLKIRFGAAKYLGNSYLLGVGFYGRKYKQTNDLAFYNELGVPNIYHFTGLGTDYYRFRGAKGESFYKGHAFGGSLDLMPAMGQGVSVAVNYNKFQFDKVISSLNELPMAAVKEDRLSGEVAWRQLENRTHRWKVNGNIDYTRRKGAENLFGASSGNVFEQIGVQDKYMNKVYAGGLHGVYEYLSAASWRISVHPALTYTDIHTTYIYPAREMEVSFFGSQMDIRLAYPVNRWFFNAEFGFFNKFRNHASLDIRQGQKPEEEKMGIPVISNYEALIANSNGFHVSLRSDYSWNRKYSVFLAVNCHYAKDQRHSVSKSVSGQLGFVF